MEGRITINEIGRRGRRPRSNVRLFPGERREFAASPCKHFGRRVDADDLGAWKGVSEDVSQVAGAATEIVNQRVSECGKSSDEVEARAKADVGIA